MNCFTHSSVAAVGICKVCAKGICPACAVEGSMAVTCSEACAQEASLLHEMNQRGKKIYGLGGGAQSVIPSGVIMWALFCIFFIAFGVLAYIRSGNVEPFTLGFGTLCGIVGLIAYRRTRSIGLQC